MGNQGSRICQSCTEGVVGDGYPTHIDTSAMDEAQSVIIPMTAAKAVPSAGLAQAMPRTEPAEMQPEEPPVVVPPVMLPETAQPEAKVETAHVAAVPETKVCKEKAAEENEFAIAAKRGCPCLILRPEYKVPKSTRYWLDSTNSKLVFGNSLNEPVITCPLGNIEDIYSFVEDGAAVFPKTFLDKLRPNQHRLTLMIVYSVDGGDKHQEFCLIEQSVTSREAFLEGLRLLCSD